jgi:hypothetical protein
VSQGSEAVDTEMPEARSPDVEGRSKSRATTTAPSLLNLSCSSIFNLGDLTVFALLFYAITNDNNIGKDDGSNNENNDDNTDEKSDNHNRDHNENDILTALLLQGIASAITNSTPNGKLSFASSVCGHYYSAGCDGLVDVHCDHRSNDGWILVPTNQGSQITL